MIRRGARLARAVWRDRVDLMRSVALNPERNEKAAEQRTEAERSDGRPRQENGAGDVGKDEQDETKPFTNSIVVPIARTSNF